MGVGINNIVHDLFRVCSLVALEGPINLYVARVPRHSSWDTTNSVNSKLAYSTTYPNHSAALNVDRSLNGYHSLTCSPLFISSMAKSKRVSSRRSKPYDSGTSSKETGTTHVKSETPSSDTPSVKPEEEAHVIEIPAVTPPPEPTPNENEKRFAYFRQHAILSSTLPGFGTFLLVRVPETTDKYKLGIIQSDGTVCELSDGITTKVQDNGEEISLNLSYIKTRSSEFRDYLDQNATDNSLSPDYSAAAIKALVGHFYNESMKELNYHSALDQWEMMRDFKLQYSGIKKMVEREVTRYTSTLPEALEVWKITERNSDDVEVRLHCLQQFKNLSSLKSSDEFYELFKSQQFTIAEIGDFLEDLAYHPYIWVRSGSIIVSMNERVCIRNRQE